MEPKMTDVVSGGATEAAPQHVVTTSEERRVIVASSVGTVFEWYDFYLYAILTPFLATLFFPTVNRITLQQMRDYYNQNPSEFAIEDAVQWQDLFIDLTSGQIPGIRRVGELVIT